MTSGADYLGIDRTLHTQKETQCTTRHYSHHILIFTSRWGELLLVYSQGAAALL